MSWAGRRGSVTVIARLELSDGHIHQQSRGCAADERPCDCKAAALDENYAAKNNRRGDAEDPNPDREAGENEHSFIAHGWEGPVSCAVAESFFPLEELQEHGCFWRRSDHYIKVSADDMRANFVVLETDERLCNS